MSADAVLDELLGIVERDPLPDADVSSHWRAYGARTVVERGAAGLVLRASGFQTLHRLGPAGQVLSRLERLSYLAVTARSRSYRQVWGDAAALARSLGADPDFYVFKSACALALIRDHCAEAGLRPRAVMLIGDGEGFLGALLRRVWPGTTIWSADLPKQLVFQARTHAAADPDARLAVGPERDGDVRFVLPADIEAIPPRIDLAVTIASLQEMSARSVHAYFACLRRRGHEGSRFYCVSRAEKILPGGEVSRFTDYPWSDADRVFVDGVCPYHTHYLSRRTGPRGPRVAGVRVPFVNHFDGVHLHRLAHLAGA
jgi:hypothetical protein